ncbi:MAG TPA: PBP1A family penicillin-binding protein [Vicinamibacterales bacterium]|nr:PBP1A family penicillin-binding protein [Vicinamibacterales bacterium]
MSIRGRLLLGSVALLAAVVFGAAWRVAAFTWNVAAELDDAVRLAELRPRPQATIVFDRHGRPAFSFFVEQRIDVPLERISPAMVDALLAIEDRRFFSHHGLDPVRIAAAAWHNARAGRIVQGGSTLTQQLARAAQLSPRRTFERKLREAMIASRLEQRYSKAEILGAYLNTVYFGEGYYGVETAAQGYFGKPAAALETHEAALLAAIVRSPSRDAPCVSPDRARSRRNLVLRRMKDQLRITGDEFQAAAAAPIPSPTHQSHGGALVASGTKMGRYFQEELRRQLVAEFGSDRVLRGGLRVYSTYDPALQQAAEEAIDTRIAQIARRRRGAQALQGSLVSLDATTGDVLALVGGRDFNASSFNRATQARRQAGSAFKPILFAAALERGYAPGTLLTELDVPIGTAGDEWLPAGDHERQEYTLRRALKVSSNRAAAQLMQQVGASTTIYYAQRLGIESPLPMVPSLALGTGDVTLLELTAAYTAFANRGTTSRPRLFTRVDDSNRVTIFSNPARHTRAIGEGTAYMMSSMLADVISGGTGAGVRGAGFRLPAGGKTGTTDDYADAWFIGYTPHIVTGVWFGLDTPAPIMARGFGGTVAVPAWARFMKEATRGHKPDWYDMPPDVEKVAICRLSGARATDACRYHYVPAEVPVGTLGFVRAGYLVPADPPPPPEPPVYEELFPLGTISSELCPLHAPQVMPWR